MINFSKNELEEMEEMYRQNYTREEIANKFNTSVKVVYNRTKHVLRNFKNKTWLEEQYITKKTTKRDIAKIARCSEWAIQKSFKEFGILTNDLISRKAKYLFNRDFFEHILSEEQAYWLGFIIADGGISDIKSQRRLRILLAATDASHLQKFIKHINGNMQIKYSETQLNNKIHPNCSLTLYSKKIVDDLNKLQVYPNKSMKEVPPNIDEKLMKHFIRGLFDGDGCISIYNDNNLLAWSIISGKEMCLFLKKFFKDKLNIHLSFCKQGNSYTVSIGNRKAVEAIMDWMYKDAIVFLDRKYEKYNSYKIKLEDIV